MALVLRSSAFAAGAAIPARFTCEGQDVSPPLAWSDAPAATRSFALIVDDPDAPDPAAPRRTWVHWVVYDLPATARELPEGAGGGAGDLPAGARSGQNDWRREGYGGPCPPVGRHRYFHKLYALDVALGDRGRPTKAELERAMKGHVLAQAELVGTYEKTGR
ncbi:MAG TPA: YbhB/YbcL family Raf kinase inhibitor-like protein [Myxococcota bacterium]|jgi:Raf kinase inhibitor-like YbhB/YbcL family protein|nr:YbhB/YbcL family Raf kinase inhibitor-like protein [Myxococcota bacterium]